MNCRDAERLWNELIDAGDSAPEELEQALEAHAASCAACAPVAARYRVLRRAIGAWSPMSAASPEFVERLRNVQDVLPMPRRSPVSGRAWLSAAAALLVAGVIGRWMMMTPPGHAPEPASPTGSLTLAGALADAASSTLELARETSAPAGRVGRAVFASASASLPDAETPAPDVSVVPTSRVLRSVGGRFGAGVRPLSGSARNAFGFLLRNAPGDEPDAPKPPKPPHPRGT
jgi:hypothetical protein